MNQRARIPSHGSKSAGLAWKGTVAPFAAWCFGSVVRAARLRSGLGAVGSRAACLRVGACRLRRGRSVAPAVGQGAGGRGFRVVGLGCCATGCCAVVSWCGAVGVESVGRVEWCLWSVLPCCSFGGPVVGAQKLPALRCGHLRCWGLRVDVGSVLRCLCQRGVPRLGLRCDPRGAGRGARALPALLGARLVPREPRRGSEACALVGSREASRACGNQRGDLRRVRTMLSDHVVLEVRCRDAEIAAVVDGRQDARPDVDEAIAP